MRKMDEMEMQISLKSIRVAWAYTVFFLFIWTIYGFITTGKFGWELFLLSSQNVILFAVKIIMTHRMTYKNEK